MVSISDYDLAPPEQASGLPEKRPYDRARFKSLLNRLEEELKDEPMPRGSLSQGRPRDDKASDRSIPSDYL